MNNKTKRNPKPPSRPKSLTAGSADGTASDNSDLLATTQTGPLVFISHDTRDAELAEAFGKLLKSVSAGMIKTFRSSDRKGSDGFDFG